MVNGGITVILHVLSSMGCQPVRQPVQQCRQVEVRRLIELGPEYQRPEDRQDSRHWHSASQDPERFINLQQTTNNYEYGRRIRFQARVTCAGGGSGRLDGHQVDWIVERGTHNQHSMPMSMRGGFGASRVQQEVTETDSEGWTQPIEFFLSQFGGDRFRIRATTQSNHQGGLQTCWYEVWRKLWVEVDTMQRPSGGNTFLSPLYRTCVELQGDLQDKFNDNQLFLRVELFDSDSRPAHRYLLTASQSQRLALTTRQARAGTDYQDEAYFQLVLVNTLGANPHSISYPFEQTQAMQQHSLGLWPAIDRSDWFAGAEVTERRASGNVIRFGTRPFLDVRTDWQSRFVLDFNNPPNVYMRINLRHLSLRFPVMISVDVNEFEEFPGWQHVTQTRAAAFVGVGYIERYVMVSTPPPPNTVYVTLILHEIGHLLGLTHRYTFGNTNNPNWENRGRGNHCTATIAGGGTCVMSETQDHGGVVFCSSCRNALRGRDLSVRLPIMGDQRFVPT